MADLSPQEFVEKWRNTQLNERQSYQMHFADVCRMVGYETPSGSGTDAKGKEYLFEKPIPKNEAGKRGFADFYYQNHFAIEYKAPDKYETLDEALEQLDRYHPSMQGVDVLVVTDIDHWEIHTRFLNVPYTKLIFTHEEIVNPSIQRFLRNLFYNPDAFHPHQDREAVTKEAAEKFKDIVDNMRGEWQAKPDDIAHFLTKLVFCLFAEDVGLLPIVADGKGVFSFIVEETYTNSDAFKHSLHQLFKAMDEGGYSHSREIEYFNGALFKDQKVISLSVNARVKLRDATDMNWEFVEPTIFGTLFERAIDPKKRSQLGAHYTSREDIELIVKPVLMQPLERAWTDIQRKAQAERKKYDNATSGREKHKYVEALRELRSEILEQVRTIKVLDPACGSGNFLYISLQLLMELEHQILNDAVWGKIDALKDESLQVHPRQMYGIEINPIAHALAQIVVWIGYLQWRIQHNHSEFSVPILEDINENIVCKDAILAFDADGNPTEPTWAEVDVIVGNPPFLGDKKMRGELGDDYVEKLRTFYDKRVPGGADLVTYWFERARAHIEQEKVKRAGLLSTNSITMGANKNILKRIKNTGDIFMAWASREWMLDGANVFVSMVGFDDGKEKNRFLNDNPVLTIYPDLTSDIDLTLTQKLKENFNLCFLGVMKSGPFDIDEEIAKSLILQSNANSEYMNNTVVRPRLNGSDINRRWSKTYIIDFFGMDLKQAQNFIAPFQYLEKNVKPIRLKNKVKSLKQNWWLHARPRPAMRNAIKDLKRYIVTSEVSKHRVFVWLDIKIVPDHTLHVIARQDDYTFGVLHSKFHEIWSIRQGATLGDNPRYSSTTTFETFPFPVPPGREDWDDEHIKAIGNCAKQLHEERDAWLNPPNVKGKALKERTLTNLYNALMVFRGLDSIKIKASAGDFAPRLDELHRALDEAVCRAYGWDVSILDDEEAILSHLLALNLERAGD